VHHIIGIILRDSNVEIIEDESPGKGSYMGLHTAIANGRKMIMENPKIRQINIYRIIQGQRILDQSMFSKIQA
jgi:hypothetical protein